MKHHHIRKLCEKSIVVSNPASRRTLSNAERREIFKKTAGTCHVCGGRAGKEWQADHVVPHRLRGKASVENFLPICRECNLLRRSHPPAVQRLIVRLGTYARNEIRRKTEIGEALIGVFLRRQRLNRQRKVQT